MVATIPQDERNPTQIVFAIRQTADAINSLVTSGTFVPTIAGEGTAGVHTYSTQMGAYRVIGDLVFFTLSLALSAKDGTMAGNTIITGLPFTSASSVGSQAITVGAMGTVTLTAGYTMFSGIIPASSTFFYLFQDGSAVAAAKIAAAAIAAATLLNVSGVYIKA